MSGWEADLVADDNPLAQRGEPSAFMVAPQKHALGTFAVAGNRIQISYVPALLARPEHLIATFAHELAHYLLATARKPPPCEDDERNVSPISPRSISASACSWPMRGSRSSRLSTGRGRAGA